jgi:uncharacterized membrane protein
MMLLRKCAWTILAAVLLGSLLGPAIAVAQEGSIDLSLRLLPDYYYREVEPGQTTTLFLEVRNNGNQAITDITLDAAEPEGWEVRFEPDSISHLGPDSSLVVDVNITPARRSTQGDHTITILAEATETRAATSAVLRIEDGPSFWLWIGIGVAVLVIAGFVVVYFRFGR